MRRVGILVILVLLLLVLSVALPTAAVASNGKAAADVEIVYKGTVRGNPHGPDWVPPGQQNKEKEEELAATGTPVPFEGTQRVAILVGSNYEGSGNQLWYVEADVQDMETALLKVGFAGEDIVVLSGADATKAKILETIADVRDNWELGPDDELVFFFSGHGVRGVKQDADKEAVDEGILTHDQQYIWDGDLASAFSGFPAGMRMLLAFDSCLSGGMTDLKADGRVIAMAATENGSSYEVMSLENGEFTYYFAEKGIGVPSGLADTTPDDGVVTAEEAWDYAKASCALDKPTINDSFADDLAL